MPTALAAPPLSIPLLQTLTSKFPGFAASDSGKRPPHVRISWAELPAVAALAKPRHPRFTRAGPYDILPQLRPVFLPVWWAIAAFLERDKRERRGAGMVRLSMNELTTLRWSFDEDVRHYAAAGFESIAVWRQKLSDFGEQKAIELLEDSGLAVSAVLWAGGFTGSDGRSHKESVEDALEAVQLTADLKAGSLVVYTGPRAGHTHNHAKRLFRNGDRRVAAVCARNAA